MKFIVNLKETKLPMRKIILLLVLSIPALNAIHSQGGFEIKVDIDDFEEEELYLAYYLGDKQYIQDTTTRNSEGEFVFKGEDNLPGGMYLVVMPPENQFFQILVDANNQKFSIRTKPGPNQLKDTRFYNSIENQNFYEYLLFLAEQREVSNGLVEEIEVERNDRKKNKLQERLDVVGTKVLNYQEEYIKEHPKSLGAAIIRANISLSVPDFENLSEEETNTNRWRWTQKHYFDNINLGDERILRTPFLFGKIDYYIQKLVVQHPDTLALAVDYILEQMKPAEATFRFYVFHFLNFYANSKFVGMDALYVHIIEKYGENLSSWLESDRYAKLEENANRLKPLLIGKTAPNIRMQYRDGSYTALHDIESSYTILYFWKYDCGFCKKSIPVLQDFYENFKEKGVAIFAVCAKLGDNVPKCWEYVDDNSIGEWIHVVDPTGKSRFMVTYDLKTTPQIYVLDENKKIISKRLGADQLEDFFNQLFEDDSNEMNED